MKKTNENLVILITLFAISIVIANVTGARTITTGLHIGPIELALSGGAITYAVTFLSAQTSSARFGARQQPSAW